MAMFVVVVMPIPVAVALVGPIDRATFCSIATFVIAVKQASVVI